MKTRDHDREYRPVMVRVARVKKETPDHTTLFFEHSLLFRPGQFIMLWLPGVDEKPYTVSYLEPDIFGVTVEAKGVFSRKAAGSKPGTLMGFRGPFGNGFKVNSEGPACVVAGGCGAAPVAPLLDPVMDDITLIQGARTQDRLLFRDRFSHLAPRYCTDDGSFGRKGFVTDLLEEHLEAVSVRTVFACGPEVMMKRVFDICRSRKIACQVSLERYMRCGFGVCGSCMCDDQRVCIDGPVFDGDRLARMSDFNTAALLKSGARVPLSEYGSRRCHNQENKN